MMLWGHVYPDGLRFLEHLYRQSTSLMALFTSKIAEELFCTFAEDACDKNGCDLVEELCRDSVITVISFFSVF